MVKLRLLKKPDTLSEQIYLDLRRRLQRCEFDLGHRLVDQEIAAAYGTSRMPAREALMRLTNEGYLVGTTRGFTLPQLTLEDIRNIFEVRSLLEPRAVANAARDMDETTAAKLLRALEEARQAVAAKDVNRMILSNIDFRNGWLSRVLNEGLAQTIARFIDHVQTVRVTTFLAQDTLEVALAGMEKLYDALVSRDADRASQAMSDFIMTAEKQFFAVAESQSREEDSKKHLKPARRSR